MSMKKLSITLPEQLAEAIREAAEREDIAVSTWLARAAEREARRQARLHAIEEFEREHGAFTPEELAQARAVLAAADAQMLAAVRKAG